MDIQTIDPVKSLQAEKKTHIFFYYSKRQSRSLAKIRNGRRFFFGNLFDSGLYATIQNIPKGQRQIDVLYMNRFFE